MLDHGGLSQSCRSWVTNIKRHRRENTTMKPLRNQIKQAALCPPVHSEFKPAPPAEFELLSNVVLAAPAFLSADSEIPMRRCP